MGIAKPARRGPVRIVQTARVVMPPAKGDDVLVHGFRHRVVLVVGDDALIARQVELTEAEAADRERRHLRPITHRSSYDVVPLSRCAVFR